ncbi:hypothetical protein WJX72_004036 [[Myrmecia] bisecta]|uniref:CDP-diacylglycerol--glycerol-3-phosphate 3-phosphatidyltransferase n=1 Tax=[Myrmecia] bisecta TaxID=41462 RepID=A0AAW1Q301_9CHLO
MLGKARQDLNAACRQHSTRWHRCWRCRAEVKSPEVVVPVDGKTTKEKLLTLPTVLTLARVAAIPLLVVVWYSQSSNTAWITSALFVAASLTDFLDGYLARKMGVTLAFGAFLDPVADKLMVATVLVLLSTHPLAGGPWAGNAWLVPLMASAIIGREITMSALREWAASLGDEAHKAVAVSAWGKWKTASQMVSLSLLLFCSQGGSGQLTELAGVTGPPLLCIAAFLTVYSLAEYFRALWRFMF